MAKADVRITINGGEMHGELQRFDPGSLLQADIHIMPQEQVSYREIRASVEWHTEGFGSRDSDTIDVTPLAQEGALQAGVPLYQRASFELPNDPWSYAGHLINIVWEVKVTVDIPKSTDINATQPFILAPREHQSPLELEQP